jgi:hypothetical protein
MGFVSVIIVSGLFALGLPLVLLYRSTNQPTITTPSTKTRSQGIWGFNSHPSAREAR